MFSKKILSAALAASFVAAPVVSFAAPANPAARLSVRVGAAKAHQSNAVAAPVLILVGLAVAGGVVAAASSGGGSSVNPALFIRSGS